MHDTDSLEKLFSQGTLSFYDIMAYSYRRHYKYAKSEIVGFEKRYSTLKVKIDMIKNSEKVKNRLIQLQPTEKNEKAEKESNAFRERFFSAAQLIPH